MPSSSTRSRICSTRPSTTSIASPPFTTSILLVSNQIATPAYASASVARAVRSPQLQLQPLVRTACSRCACRVPRSTCSSPSTASDAEHCCRTISAALLNDCEGSAVSALSSAVAGRLSSVSASLRRIASRSSALTPPVLRATATRLSAAPDSRRLAIAVAVSSLLRRAALAQGCPAAARAAVSVRDSSGSGPNARCILATSSASLTRSPRCLCPRSLAARASSSLRRSHSCAS